VPSAPDHRIFIERLLIATGFVLVLAVLWSLKHLLVLVIGAAVIAILLRALADPIMRWTGLGTRGSALLATLLIASVVGLAIWLFGVQIASQFSRLGEAIPEAWRNLNEQLASMPMGNELIAMAETVTSDRQGLVERFGSLLRLIGDAISSLVLIVFGAIFFAAQPQLYRQGLLFLFPKHRRPLLDEAIGDAGRALRLWLQGQLISMVIVGVLTGIGLWLAGVPAPLALALIAGITEAIPYIGPIIAAIPGLLIALLEGPETALWALAVYVLVQQVEGNTVQPIVQRQMVTLPPALTLFSLVAGGLLFGLIGLIFAAPLLVIAYVLVKRLYVQEALGTPTSIPGRNEGSESENE
jgi:predicted PurR-regulated permease PerM